MPGGRSEEGGKREAGGSREGGERRQEEGGSEERDERRGRKATKKHQICEKAFRQVLRETPLFLPGTFRDCGVLVCSKTPDFLDKKCQQLARTTP